MNKICEHCDTRCRLRLCKGKDGDFKYCYRRTGSLTGLEETITQFSTLHELYEKTPDDSFLHCFNPETLELYGCYGSNDYMGALAAQKDNGEWRIIGYVTLDIEDVTKIKQLKYTDEANT